MKNFSSLLLSFFIIPFLLNAQAPEIDVWYGDNQKFGHLGQAQDQIDILGKVSDPQGTNTITSLTYTLNGSSSRNLNIGPYKSDERRRLFHDGDFVIEIFLTDPNLNSTGPFPTNNTVIITAVDENNNSTNETVNFNFFGDVVWTLPYSISWDTVTNIQNVAQVIDGEWRIYEYSTGNFGVRPKNNAWGYDRLIGIGDVSWGNYEVLVRVYFHQFYPIAASPSVGAFVGVGTKWNGHTDNPKSGWEPKVGWLPQGASAGYAMLNSFLTDYMKYQLGGIGETLSSPPANEQFFRVRVQKDGVTNYFAFKYWDVGNSEPNSWNFEGYRTGSVEPMSGSIYLLAHNVDASFGDITITPLSPLPVELISFNAQANTNGEILLSWETATELNNYGFEIERTSGNSELQWTSVGFVEGNGNSNSPKSYSFTDNPNYSSKYFYRLKQIDNDGSYEYSNLVEVIINAPSVYALAQNFPNPFNPSTTIEFSIPEESRVSLIIYNALGQELITLNEGLLAQGNHSVLFDASSLTSGNYIYVLTGNSIAHNSEFRIVKKMTVLK